MCILNTFIDVFIDGVLVFFIYSAVRTQNTLTPSLKVVQESGFSGTAYNSTHVSGVQSLIAKRTLQTSFT